MSIGLWVALGSALGGGLRYLVGEGLAVLWQPLLPIDTLLVNISGSLLIGFYAAMTGVDGRLLVPSHIRQFVMTGVLGGYTTFSVFSLESLELFGRVPGLAILNMLLTIAGALLAVCLGHMLAMAWNRPARRDE